MPVDTHSDLPDFEAVPAELRWLYERVTIWLQFADAKNGALIALSIAICAVLMRTMASAQGGATEIPLAFKISLCLSSLSALIAVLSFLPVLSNPDPQHREVVSIDDNLYFFYDIATYDAKSFLAALSELHGTPVPRTDFPAALADQIVANARIVVRKLEFFRSSAVCLMGAVVMMVVPLVI